jgi:hypothetical protein
MWSSAAPDPQAIYHSKMVKLAELEGLVVNEVIRRVGPNGLLDEDSFHLQVVQALDGNAAIAELKGEILKLRTSRTRQAAILRFVQHSHQTTESQHPAPSGPQSRSHDGPRMTDPSQASTSRQSPTEGRAPAATLESGQSEFPPEPVVSQNKRRRS